MKLHSLTNNPGASKRRKRLGCGQGSGRGKTSSRGVKGYKSRSGSSIRPGFGSGQIPLYRTLPHRGFNRARFKEIYSTVNVGELEKLEGDEAHKETLTAAGLIRKDDAKLKVLGSGELSKSLTVTADAFSASAKEKIEKAGGKVIVLEAAKEAPEPASEEGNA